MTPAEVDLTRRIILAREAAGLHTTYDDRLPDAARAHAADMARNPGLRHIGSDGSDGGQRIRRAGYEWKEWGEVIGWGFGGDTARMVQWWLESPQHRDILLSPVLRDIGVGVARGDDGQWYYVVALATLRRASEPSPVQTYAPVVTGGGG